MPRFASHLAATLLCAGLAIVAGSCTRALDLDGYRGAATELCALLADCYGAGFFPGCEGSVGRAIEQADPAARNGWLTFFGDNDCLRNCTRGKRCLDQAPVCRQTGQACDQKEQCCGFTNGEGTCGVAVDTAVGQCCLPDGLPCTVGNECCRGDCSSLTYTCAGQVCAHENEPCQYSTDCCSLNCGPGNVCLPQCLGLRESCGGAGECCSHLCETGFCACRADGEGCTLSSECCTGYCNSTGQCGQTVPCTIGGEGCSTTDCCEGFHCGNALGLVACCLPNQQSCLSPDECCGLGCEKSACCAAFGVTCAGDGDCCYGHCASHVCACANAAETCSDQQDCCNGLACAISELGLHCAECTTASCHLPCEQGAPLSLFLDNCPELSGAEACIQAVCQSDSVCCCSIWDSWCVQEAALDALVPGDPCWGLC